MTRLTRVIRQTERRGVRTVKCEKLLISSFGKWVSARDAGSSEKIWQSLGWDVVEDWITVRTLAEMLKICICIFVYLYILEPLALRKYSIWKSGCALGLNIYRTSINTRASDEAVSNSLELWRTLQNFVCTCGVIHAKVLPGSGFSCEPLLG